MENYSFSFADKLLRAFLQLSLSFTNVRIIEDSYNGGSVNRGSTVLEICSYYF